MTTATDSPKTYPAIETAAARLDHRHSALIEVLHAAQNAYSYLDREMLRLTARLLSLPESLVYGVATFYHAFRLTPPGTHNCSVCTGTACHLKGGSRILEELRSSDAASKNSITAVRCIGACGMAPLAVIDGSVATVASGRELAALLARGVPGTGTVPASVAPATGESRQTRIVLANSGVIDPESLQDARNHGAYRALATALRELTPTEVRELIAASGLRGRGGGGYPTGRKWQQVAAAPGIRKFVIANGDEGDPGAFMDRTLMETDPHRLIEGMAIAAHAVGAEEGFIYVRNEYPLALKRLGIALREATADGIIGRSLLGIGPPFRLELRTGAGAFVCGEETALLASVMGRRGQPSPRPPYPSEQGLFGCPTLINNVETFGSVPPIITGGAAGFRAIGTPGNCGTKVFAVSGDINRVGTVEVPFGATLREIIMDFADGMADGTAFKAAQTGGAGGGCIPAAALDIPLEYESLTSLGSMIGSGGLVIINEHRCMVDLAAYFVRFSADESCGACVPCRAGLAQLQLILERIRRGLGTPDDPRRLTELCAMMHESSLCGLGSGAPRPVLSTLRWFGDEFEEHCRHHRCPVGVCPMDGAEGALP